MIRKGEELRTHTGLGRSFMSLTLGIDREGKKLGFPNSGSAS